MIIFSSNNQYIYHRSYPKIQAILAQVGGLANVLMQLFTCTCYIFSIVEIDSEILNALFQYDVKNKKEEISLNRNKLLNLNQLDITAGLKINKTDFLKQHTTTIEQNYVTKIKNDETLNVDNNIDESKIGGIKKLKNETKRQENSHLHFTYFEILKIYICGKYISSSLNNRKKMYFKLKDTVEKYLDVINFVHKINEIEKLKCVLLTKDQINLFNFVNKDVKILGDIENKNNQLNILRKLDDDKINLDQLIHDLKNRIELNNQSEIDNNLYEMIKKKLKE